MKGYIEQPTLFGHPAVVGFGNDVFAVKEIDRNKANALIIANHYSGKTYNLSKVHLGVFIGGDLLGVLQYGLAMNPASASSVVEGTASDEYLELNRMWLDDAAPRNTASRALSYSIKYIKRKLPKVAWIQSFADERCGKLGLVYQSANFTFHGEHKSVFWELDGVFYHNIAMTTIGESATYASARMLQANKDRAKAHEYRQFRYLYFVKKSARRRVRHQEREAPKWYKEIEEGETASHEQAQDVH